MRRTLGNGYELDDDPDRVDRAAVHAFLVGSYWAEGRPREVSDELVSSAARVAGLYRGDALVGFARVVSDGHTVGYLADVYVLDEHRGRGFGLELVRFAVCEGPLAGVRKWLLHTRDAHGLYRQLGFGAPDERFMERWVRVAPNDGP